MEGVGQAPSPGSVPRAAVGIEESFIRARGPPPATSPRARFPKDGPSAGVKLWTRSYRRHGRGASQAAGGGDRARSRSPGACCPLGGIRRRSWPAHSMGSKEVILPSATRRRVVKEGDHPTTSRGDLKDPPRGVSIEEVLELALTPGYPTRLRNHQRWQLRLVTIESSKAPE